MSIEVGLNPDLQGPRTHGELWQRWWSRAGLGWRTHCADRRRCAETRLRLGFERVPPRVWARHGALLSTARDVAQGRQVL